jgi:hypothetical protein
MPVFVSSEYKEAQKQGTSYNNTGWSDGWQDRWSVRHRGVDYRYLRLVPNQREVGVFWNV